MLECCIELILMAFPVSITLSQLCDATRFLALRYKRQVARNSHLQET